jgi:putative thioredoxin
MGMTVIDVTEQTFATDVIERSRTTPVVVDFWASWCAPCRSLGPILEAAAERREGKVVLAKLDTDANPELSRQFGIQSIPAVKAFSGGEVVEGFIGAQPPAVVERFFDALVPSEADDLVASGDEQSLRRALELDPNRADALVPLARILLARGETDAALDLLDRASGNFQAEGLAARARLERELDEEPELADLLRPAFAALDEGALERALDLLIEALPSADARRDQIRQVVVGELDALSPSDPLARDARRRLAAALY